MQWEGGAGRPSDHVAQLTCDGGGQGRVGRRVEVDAVDGAGGDDILSVEVGAAKAGSERFIMPWQLAAAVGTVEDLVIEIRQVGEVTDGRRAEEEEFGRRIAGAAVAGEDEASEDPGTGGDFSRWHMKDGLQVVGAEHEHDHVDGLVAFEAGGEVVDAPAGEIEGVVMDGGAAVLTFLDDTPLGAQFSSKAPGPANADGVTHRIGQADGRGIKAPGVGVAKAEDGFHRKGKEGGLKDGESGGAGMQFFEVLKGAVCWNEAGVSEVLDLQRRLSFGSG